MRSGASHPACPHGWLSQKTVNRDPNLVESVGKEDQMSGVN